MMDLDTLYIILNSILLTVVLILTFIIIRAGSIHTFHIGDDVIQTKMKWIILRAVVAMVAVGLVAALVNFILQS